MTELGSAYKLNKHGDSLQPSGTAFPTLNQSIVPCPILTVVIYTVKGMIKKSERDVYFELSCFFDEPVDVGNLISGSSAFSKTSLKIWTLSVQVLLTSSLTNFEDYFASM